MDRFTHRGHLLGFLAATAIMAAVGLSIMLATQRFREDTSRVEHSQQLIGRIAQIRARLFDGIATQRSYLLTGDAAFRTEYFAARPAIHGDINRLVALTTDNAAQFARVERLERLIGARLDSADSGVRIFEQQGLEALQEELRAKRGLRITRQIEAAATELEQAERERLRQSTAASRRSASLLLLLGVLGIPLSLGILWWIFALLSREARQREHAERRLGLANEQLVASVTELERAGADLRELGRYSSHLQGCRTLDEAMDATRQALITLLPWCAGTVYLLRASLDHAEAAIQWGEAVAPHKAALVPADCWGLRRGRPHLVEDLRRGTACAHFSLPPEVQPVTTACFPLGSQNAVIGVLALSQRRAGPIPRIEIAAAVAEQLSLALGNLQLQESLRQQSIRDPLTGLYNRRYLEESLTRELARCARLGQPLALMMLDLDRFKAFNDGHGHESGDRLLAAFGELLLTLCRQEDIACRYGGEEFTLILPGIPREAAIRRADEIRNATRQLVVEHRQQRLRTVTVSIGLSMYPDDAVDGSQLREAADVALYRAKHAGRDRLELASGP